MTEPIKDIFLFSKKMEVYEKIRIVRQAKEYSQEYMADKLNLDTVNYGRIERGQTKLTIKKLEDIAEILNVPTRLFFYEDDLNYKEFERKLFDTLKDNNELLQNIYSELNEIKSKLK